MNIKNELNTQFKRVLGIISISMIAFMGYAQEGAGTDTDRMPSLPDSLEEAQLPSERAFGDEGFDLDRGDDVPSEISEALAEESLGETLSEDHRRPLFNLKKCMPCMDPFIRDTEIDFQMNTAYYSRTLTNFNNNGVVKKQNTAALAPTLKYRSGWWNDMIRFGVTGATVFEVSNSSTAGIPGARALLKNGENNYSLLRQFYIHTKFQNIEALIGRQYIRAPLLGSGAETSFIPNDFEAYLFQVKDLPVDGLRVLAGQVTKMRFNGGATSPRAMKFRSMSEAALIQKTELNLATKRRGVTTVVASYQPNDALTAGFAYHYGWDTLDAWYADISYTIDCGNCLEIEPCAQLIYQGSVGDHLLGVFNAYGYGLKIQAKYKGWYAIASMTQTLSRQDTLFDYWGDYPGFNSQVLSDFNSGGERAYGFSLGYDFAYDCLKGLTLSGNYVYGHKPNPQAGEREINFTLDYIFPQDLLRGFWFRFRTARLDQSSQFFSPNDGGGRISDIRLFLYYTRPII